MPTDFVVKNGSKTCDERLGVHAGARVADGQHHVRAGVRLAVVRDVLVVELHVGGLDRQHAAVGHRVARVDREVEQHLLELVRVREHAVQLRLERVRRARGPRRSAVESIGVIPSTTSLSSRTRGWSTWRRLKASSWRVRIAARSAAAAIWSSSGSELAVASVEQGLRVAADHGEQVVEVVGDAAGEAADRLEPLRLAQLLLELEPRR